MYEGRIFRPPSEASSFILQVTVGCAHNDCTFCSMYKEKAFRIKPIEEVLEIIKAFSVKYPNVERVFVADGDALILPMAYWTTLLTTLKQSFPALKRVTAYGTPRDVLGKTLEELKTLKNEGLEMIYMGLETGSDKLLERIKKGATAAEMAEAGQKLKAAGLRQSVTVISGIGGRSDWEEHAVKTAEVLNLMDPEYVGLLTLLLDDDTPMLADIRSGKMAVLSPEEVLCETKLLIENLNLSNCQFRSNHASNYLALSGHLPTDKGRLLSTIDSALNNQSQLKSEWHRRL